MKILFDARPETMYPLAGGGFSGGSQVYIKAVVKGLAANGHDVHVIAQDLEVDEQRGPNEHWWPPTYFPRKVDVAVIQMHAFQNPEYDAPLCVLMTSCIDPYVGPNDEWVPAFEAVPVFSEVHKKLLLETRPFKPEQVFVTGLGVNLADYYVEYNPLRDGDYLRQLQSKKVYGRMLYANDPARGLFYTLDVFDEVKKNVPEATLHVAYDFDNQWEMRKYEHSQMAEYLLECKKRLDSTPGVRNLGGLNRREIIREQIECAVHCYPSDPPGRGTQTHGLTQLECAAAGAALVLSDVEAFPEIFGEGAQILPTIGTYVPALERRYEAKDYAYYVSALMRNPLDLEKQSHKARRLAESMTWDVVIEKWERMLETIREGSTVNV